jgi:hypothetical protein
VRYSAAAGIFKNHFLRAGTMAGTVYGPFLEEKPQKPAVHQPKTCKFAFPSLCLREASEKEKRAALKIVPRNPLICFALQAPFSRILSKHLLRWKRCETDQTI